jgi:hypothetical protein
LVKPPGRPNVVLPPLEVFPERRTPRWHAAHAPPEQTPPGLPKARRKGRSTMGIDPHDSPFEGRTSKPTSVDRPPVVARVFPLRELVRRQAREGAAADDRWHPLRRRDVRVRLWPRPACAAGGRLWLAPRRQRPARKAASGSGGECVAAARWTRVSNARGQPPQPLKSRSHIGGCNRPEGTAAQTARAVTPVGGLGSPMPTGLPVHSKGA